MNRKAYDSPFDIGPTTEEIADFDPESGHCCSAEEFRVDLEDTPRSAWNTSAARVFAESFIAKYPRCPATEAEIEGIWSKHLGYLMNAFKKRGIKSPAHRRAERQANVTVISPQ
jgi:hypothetical protein